MKLLILGGTKFLGKHITEAALARGHQVTLFNRGQTNPDLFPQVEKIQGDRETRLDQLTGHGPWDAVIDTSGYVPRIVRASAEALKDKVDLYVFISTISVFSDNATPNQNENAPLISLEDSLVEEITGETYGGLKALCERAVEDVMGTERTLTIRPGLIVGPDDPTDRFTYWPVRIAQGGDILVPGRPETRTQIVDVRDLAEWIVLMVEHHASGTYNASGPLGGISMGELVEKGRQALGSDASFVWIDEKWLLEQGVGPWMELPLWLPEGDAALMKMDVSKAVNAGLTFRPIETIMRDTLAWDQSRQQPIERRAGMKPEREQELLQLWKERTQA
jgi:2'-hydroxyisoflavone reductase